MLVKCLGCGSIWYKPPVRQNEREDPKFSPRNDDLCYSCSQRSSVLVTTHVVEEEGEQ